MDTGFLNLLMNFIGPALLAAVIAYFMVRTWRRRQNPAAQARTDRATHEIYEAEERERERREGP